MRASVLIATRNRGALLADVLKRLAEIDFPTEEWEVIVVDNGSTDSSYSLARQIVAAMPNSGKVVQEPRAGLSHARNCAIRAAKGELLVFLDDDAFVERHWLSTLKSAFDDATVLAAGGGVVPRFESELPSWFDDCFLAYVSAWDLGPEAQQLRYNEYPRGANLAFRREVFERFGEFHPRLGRRGPNLRSCEETEICLRIERGRGKIVYVPNAAVAHVVSTSRLSEQWMKQRFFAQGESEALLEWRHGGVAALRHGYRRSNRIADNSFEQTSLLAQCQRQAHRGYMLGAIKAPFLLRRYLADQQGLVAGDWSQLSIPEPSHST